MRSALRRQWWVAVLAGAVAGCGSAPASPVAPAPIVTTAPTTARTAPPPATTAPPTIRPRPSRTAAPQPALPPGQVPDEVVGRWTGGEGSKSGEYLVIDSTGHYARGKNDSDPYRAGVIVARGDTFVTYDVDGRQESGRWQYTNAAGIEVLGVYFGPDYYSYVRA